MPGPARSGEAPKRDAFGIARLFPTRREGREWLAKWNNGHARSFGYATDPDDPWLDAAHGDGRQEVDGAGRLTASGDHVRLYVHDPAHQAEWGENLEITLYVTRVSETQSVSYSGLQVFARTNHGALGDETRNRCDSRGYGAKVTADGRWEFEKETAHHLDNGYASTGTARPWKELPKGVAVGIKYVIRNAAGGSRVKVELYRDLTNGANGGAWERIAEATDTGTGWGTGAAPAKPGVKPEMLLTRRNALADSESGKPMLTVYFRHEYGTMRYERASIREIDPLP